MSPFLSNALVAVAALVFTVGAWMYFTGLVRIGAVVSGLAMFLGALVRMRGGSPTVYEATTWVMWLGVVVVVVGLGRQWMRRQRPTQDAP
jgi:hypothetical protein